MGFGYGDKLLFLIVLIILLFLIAPIKFAATFGALLAAGTFWYVQQTYGTLKRLGIPHDPPNFLLGNLMQMMKNGGLHEFDMEMTQKHGQIHGYFLP